MYKRKCFEIYNNLAAMQWFMVLPGCNGKKTRSLFPAIIILQCMKRVTVLTVTVLTVSVTAAFQNFIGL